MSRSRRIGGPAIQHHHSRAADHGKRHAAPHGSDLAGIRHASAPPAFRPGARFPTASRLAPRRGPENRRAHKMRRPARQTARPQGPFWAGSPLPHSEPSGAPAGPREPPVAQDETARRPTGLPQGPVSAWTGSSLSVTQTTMSNSLMEPLSVTTLRTHTMPHRAVDVNTPGQTGKSQ